MAKGRVPTIMNSGSSMIGDSGYMAIEGAADTAINHAWDYLVQLHGDLFPGNPLDAYLFVP